jgi:CheY-like chemotaxis protein
MLTPADKRVVLLIDDDTNIRKTASRRLAEEGYRVLTASDGEEGLKVARAEHPSLILLDLMMPKMDGREVLRRLKSDPETKQIPVILLTVIETMDEFYAPVPLGDAFYISKPYQPQKLLKTIELVMSIQESRTTIDPPVES